MTAPGELPAPGNPGHLRRHRHARHCRPLSALPAEPLVTAITLAELSAGPLVARDERERAARQAHLQEAEADFDPLRSTAHQHAPTAR
jgi:hypothetical protein